MKGRKKPDHFVKPHNKTPGFVVQIPEGLILPQHPLSPTNCSEEPKIKALKAQGLDEAASVASYLADRELESRGRPTVGDENADEAGKK